mmetsp:Transcript_45818/g.147118  ORF Transcript_45818/g.147118 Transcript_45818/m.147118 type:complete len:304 (+) Transcript_45818:779-1690(+)
MLVLERQCETVDDAAEYFQKLTNTVVSLALVDDLEEDVLDGPADEGAEGHELAVDAVEDGLQVVALTRILGVEQLQKLKHEVLIDEALGNLGIHVVGHHEAQEELVHDLQVRPGPLQARLLLVGVREGQRVLVACGQGPEDVGTNHVDDVLHQCLVEAIALVVHVLHDFQQRLALGLLLALVGIIVEVEHHRADLKLAAEQVHAFAVGRLAKLRQSRKAGPYVEVALLGPRGRRGRLPLQDSAVLCCGLVRRRRLLLFLAHPPLYILNELHGYESVSSQGLLRTLGFEMGPRAGASARTRGGE